MSARRPHLPGGLRRSDFEQIYDLLDAVSKDGERLARCHQDLPGIASEFAESARRVRLAVAVLERVLERGGLPPHVTDRSP